MFGVAGKYDRCVYQSVAEQKRYLFCDNVSAGFYTNIWRWKKEEMHLFWLVFTTLPFEYSTFYIYGHMIRCG